MASVSILSAPPGRTDDTQAPRIDLAQLEKQIHGLVNAEREQHGLKPLDWDDRLRVVARAHSRSMAENGFFSHIDRQGRDPAERGRSMGYHCRKDYGRYYTEGIAENLFQTNLYDSVREVYRNGELIDRIFDWSSQEEIARFTVRGWMQSPEHRHNILDEQYDREGIGIVVSEDDKVYITQNFC